GDEIGRALARHLQVFDLVEVSRQRFAGLDGGVDHDGEKGGTRHYVVLAWLMRTVVRRRDEIPSQRRMDPKALPLIESVAGLLPENARSFKGLGSPAHPRTRSLVLP